MFTVGEILRKEREKQGVSLTDIEKKIRVREKFLQAIEDNDWQIFSSKTYIAGVIKNYADVLGIDHERVLAFFRRDYAHKEEVTFKKKISSKHLIPESRKYAIGGLVLLFAALALYFGYQLKLYFSPPKVEILSPKTYTFKKQDRIKVIGKTEKEASVMIFNERIYQNKEGVFTYDFPLNPGRNELAIEVTGANGKKTVIRREFFLNP
ncbi:helix-turn-helix domain-containing protein [Candidatus Roizmanbacteria bacterium]|nr:helix-turn-helix domain-containing protein [Candidatus Roizmanbacteria bacterium]